MKVHLPDNVSQIVDEIISEMPLEERVSLANMKKKEVEVLQGVFDLYIRDKIESEDMEYEELQAGPPLQDEQGSHYPRAVPSRASPYHIGFHEGRPDPVEHRTRGLHAHLERTLQQDPGYGCPG